MAKKKEHSIDSKDTLITREELLLIFKGQEDLLEMYVANIFCLCSENQKKLVDYKAYVNDLYDIVLRGKCDQCHEIAARYIETGERKDNRAVIEKILERKRSE